MTAIRAEYSDVKLMPGETADGYSGTITQSGRWRVVRCKDDIQWILQKDKRKDGAGCAKRPWRGVAYIVNEHFLRPVISRPSLEVPSDDLAVLLEGLP